MHHISLLVTNYLVLGMEGWERYKLLTHLSGSWVKCFQISHSFEKKPSSGVLTLGDVLSSKCIPYNRIVLFFKTLLGSLAHTLLWVTL